MLDASAYLIDGRNHVTKNNNVTGLAGYLRCQNGVTGQKRLGTTALRILTDYKIFATDRVRRYHCLVVDLALTSACKQVKKIMKIRLLTRPRPHSALIIHNLFGRPAKPLSVWLKSLTNQVWKTSFVRKSLQSQGCSRVQPWEREAAAWVRCSRDKVRESSGDSSLWPTAVIHQSVRLFIEKSAAGTGIINTGSAC